MNTLSRLETMPTLVMGLPWDGIIPSTLRERRIAKLFNGYHYILTILAEIHPGFVPIVRTHAQIIIEDNSKPWNPPIYKIVLLDEPTRITYLIGAVHTRMMNEANKDPEGNFSREILSENVREILKSSDAVALEILYGLESPEFKSKINSLQLTLACKKIVHGQKDRFQLQRLFDANNVKNSADGLDASALLFSATEKNEAPYPLTTTLYSLETEDTQIKAITEVYTFAKLLDSDLNDVIELLDQGIYGESAGIEQCIPGLMRRPQSSVFMTQMQWRNPPMAESILKLMESHKTTTVLVEFCIFMGRPDH